MALTVATVKATKAPGTYGDGQGLYLQVSAGGSKSWLYRYQIGKRRREMGLGSVADVSLAEARDLAAVARKLVAAGHDPIAARSAERLERAQAEARATTFKDAAEAFVDSHEAGWRNAKHRQQWRNTLEAYVYPLIGSRPVSAIGTEDVLKVLRPIWTTKPETASRVRGRVERVLSAAKVAGQRTGENPAMWRGHLDQVLPPRSKVQRVRHQPALPYTQVPAFLLDLRALKSVSARALELTILTAARTTETRLAVPDEFDLKATLWTIPAVRMKAEREHRVPLCERAVEIVREMLKVRVGPYLFPGEDPDGPLSDMAMLECLRGLRPGYTVHGFRSSFRDWAGEETAHPHDICEAALAHTRKDKTHAAYQRGELLAKRRVLMTDWAAWCEGAPPAPPPSAPP